MFVFVNVSVGGSVFVCVNVGAGPAGIIAIARKFVLSTVDDDVIFI